MQTTCTRCGFAYASDQADGLCPRCLAGMAGADSAPPPEENPLAAGQAFHGLEVKALVARGGMGIVYRARDPKLNRDVALKILPRSLAAEPEFRRRFDREARALAGLSHPNIVNVLDFGVEGDLMFLVMEFVEGTSLRAALRGKRVSQDRVVRIALELCEALAFAHGEGVIHRDVKPDNVLLDPSGRVKLMDFGLAKSVDIESTQFTQSNLVIGTPHYMSPEQLERPRDVDHRADLYSLGVLLYEMLTRELPIGRFPAPSVRAGVDPRFDAIVLRCLEKEPDRRFETIAELKAALKPLAGVQGDAAAPGALDRPTPARPKTSNLELACPCGAKFLVPIAARGVHCPACGEPVRIGTPPPAPKAEPPPPPPNPATLPAPRKLILGAAVLTVFVAILVTLILISGSSPRRDEISYTPPLLPADLPPGKTPDAPTPRRPETQRTEVLGAVESPRNAAQLRKQLEAAVAEINLSGLVATIHLYSGNPIEHDQLQKRIGEFDPYVRDLLAALRAQGAALEPPERFRFGDRIAAFAGKPLLPAHTMGFADDLRLWLHAFKPGVTESVTVTRDRKPVTFLMTFPEKSPELIALAQRAGVVLGDAPSPTPIPPERPVHPSPPPSAPPATPFPAATLADLTRRFSALPAYYRESFPAAERVRAEALIAAGKGSDADVAFLAGPCADLLRRAEAEQAFLSGRVRDLEARLTAPGAAVDVVYFKDGQRMEGTVTANGDSVKIAGKAVAATRSTSDVQRIDYGKGPAAEAKARYEPARGKKPALLDLLAWAKERNFADAKDLAAGALLLVDPGDERTRAELGLPRTPYSSAPEPQPVRVADRIEYGGRTYTSEQLGVELKSLGYVQFHGLWCEKVPRVFRIDNLYRDEGKLAAAFHGTSVLSLKQTEKGVVYDVKTQSYVPQTKEVGIARYIGGAGTCSIQIDAPGEIVECRVRARSQVAKVGGHVSVAIAIDPGDKDGKLLYTLASPGKNDTSYDVSDKVAGQTRFYIVATLKTDGMFLPSDTNDLGVLEVKYSYAKPLDRVNAVLGLHRDAPARIVSTDIRTPNDVTESSIRQSTEVPAAFDKLTDALARMREATESMVYTAEFAVPSRFNDVATLLKDPLAPDWNGMGRDQAVRLGEWWSSLGLADRREFLAAYGLWCARLRHLRGSK